MASFLLLAVGLLLVLLEFFLPGGIMGTVGGLFIIGSVILFATGDNGLLPTLGFTALAIIGTITVIRYSLKRVQASEGGFYSAEDQEGYHAAEIDQNLVGETGEALTDLKPSGHITIHNQRHQAVSQSGYITKGTKVTVVGGEGAHLTVRPTESYQQ